MKILQIRFKNLNALYGEWLIDLREPIYQDSGIFAIIGPTGSGKSTLLDAICLALYGETPRLGKITKSKNDIMARQTGECFAEVLFETDKGLFISQFSQRRAKKQIDGALQEPLHHLAYASGEIIENKRNLVGKAIIETTGMDFARFTRSMLLAQGGFDSFLKASDDDKSKILQQITASALYSEISKQVFGAHKEAKLAYDNLILLSSNLSVLDEKARLDLETSQKEITQNLLELSHIAEQKKKALDWLLQQQKISESLRELNKALVAAKARKTTFLPNITKITAAEKALSIQPSHTTLVHYTQLLDAKNKEVAKISSLTPQLELQLSTHSNAVLAHSALVEKSELELRNQIPTLEQVKQLDIELVQLNKQITQLQSELKKEEEIHKKNKNEQQDIQKASKAIEDNMVVSHHFMSQGDGKTLKEILPHWSTLLLQINRAKQLRALEQVLHSQLADLNQAKITHSNELTKHKTQEKELLLTLENLNFKQAQIKEMEGTLLNNQTIEALQEEKELLTRSLYYIQTVVNLEVHREKLVKESPCPLCGSKEHPYVDDSTVMADKTATEKAMTTLNNKLKKIGQLKSEHETLSITQKEVNEKIFKTSIAVEKVVQSQQFTEQKITDLTSQLKVNTLDLNEVQGNIEKLINPLNLSLFTQPLEELLVTLETLRQQYEDHQTILNQGEAQLLDLNIKNSHLCISMQERENYLKKSLEQIQNLTEGCDLLKQTRFNLFADKNPATIQLQLEENLHVLKVTLKKMQAEQQNLTEIFTINRTELNALQNEILTVEQKKLEASIAFEKAISSVGFADIEQFKDALLSQENLNSLKNELSAIEGTLISLNALIQNEEQSLSKLLALQLTTEPYDKIALDIDMILQSLEATRKKQIEIETLLSQDNEARKKMGGLTKEIAKSKENLLRHEKLNLLIGSADGKKFRHFAQGITFEILVSHANQQLTKMSDRYLLIRDDSHPLALNVIDNYQAGEIRTINNLSGGESFIVSLALALGLSQMSSQKTRVDSLFLDEGFGTLDEEALDIALDALSSLHQENKLIGIISHVPQLKNRISTQIIIDAGHGGRSKIIGHGVKQFS